MIKAHDNIRALFLNAERGHFGKSVRIDADNFTPLRRATPAAHSHPCARGDSHCVFGKHIDDDLNIPFLRFHPTLAIASADSALAEDSATRERDVWINPIGPGTLRAVFHLDVDAAGVERALEVAAEVLA